MDATTSDGTEGQVPGRSQSAMRRIELRWDELYLSLQVQNEELAEYICLTKFVKDFSRNFVELFVVSSITI